MTEDGYKNIEDVEVGDKVLAYDEKTGEQAYKKVVQLFRGETKEWCHIYVNGEKIISTPGHKYYVPENVYNREKGEKLEHANYAELNEKWVSAKNLKIGDKIVFSNGNYGIIEKIELEEVDSTETTYNLEVEDFHTYYVGEGILVHNANCGEVKKKAFSIEQDGVYVEVRPGEVNTNHHSPHAHVSGNGPDTTVGLNRLPVNHKHPPLSNQQVKMVNRNWKDIEKLIRKIWKK